MGESKTETKTDVKVPKEGEFEGGKLWFSRRGNILTIGLTSGAIDKLGDLDGITLPEEGDHFDAGDEIVTVDGTRGSVEVTLPTKGVVLSVNPVASDPVAVSEDPLEEGWLVRYQIEDLEALLDLESD
ncbi:MAG: glycine cleavage system protein H [Bdellovibrionales bacterium]|nr:glycine cleavage system protein H [Bdellovibrionales bacterium]